MIQRCRGAEFCVTGENRSTTENLENTKSRETESGGAVVKVSVAADCSDLIQFFPSLVAVFQLLGQTLQFVLSVSDDRAVLFEEARVRHQVVDL